MIEQLQKHFVRGMAEGSLGSLGVVKPRGAVRGEGALRVYCSKQLRKLHLGPLDGEGAYGGIWSCTGSHTCRVAFSPLVLTPSNWWLGVALMTTVHSGRRGALCTPASYPYSPRLRDLDSTLRPNHAGAQSRRYLCHHLCHHPTFRATKLYGRASHRKRRPQLHSAHVIAYTTTDPTQHERLRR